MEGKVTFDIAGADSAPGKVWTLAGYAGAPLPIDLLAQYVLQCHQAMWDDLDNHRDPRAVPTQFAVTYDDGFTTSYKVVSVLRNNQEYDSVGLMIVS